MPSTITPNMGLIKPTIGSEPSPNWAQDLNIDWTTVDQHNHTAGSGVQIPTAGLSIDADLSLNGFNLTTVRSVRFNPQPSPLSLGTDLGCIYESGVDLYYNDGNGNQIRITQGGAVVGTPGSITGLVPPASASYSPGLLKFIWQSGVNTAATMDMGSIIIRKPTAGSNGITLQAPVSLPGNYSITFPSTTPASPSFVTLNNAGQIGSFPYTLPAFNAIMTIDNSGTIATGPASLPSVTSNVTISSTGVVSTGRQTALNQQVISAVGFNNISSADHIINTLPFTNIDGRPVQIQIRGDSGGDAPFVQYNSTGGTSPLIWISTPNGDTLPVIFCNKDGGTAINDQAFAGGIAIDTGATVGSGNYIIHINTAGNQLQGDHFGLIAFEL